MSLTKILLEFNTKERFNRLVKFMENHHFVLYDERVSKYYIGRGAYGSVYKSPKYPNLVVRIGELFFNDDKAYDKVLGRDFDNVVNVKFHKQYSTGRKIFVTVMEELEPLDEDLEDTMGSIKNKL